MLVLEGSDSDMVYNVGDERLDNGRRHATEGITGQVMGCSDNGQRHANKGGDKTARGVWTMVNDTQLRKT